jgi:tetratricopeptide (TPR) repeat protein
MITIRPYSGFFCSFLLVCLFDFSMFFIFNSILCAYQYCFAALVNKGNCLYVAGDYEKAREFYQEAISVESLCAEALFNLGMHFNKAPLPLSFAYLPALRALLFKYNEMGVFPLS